MDTGMTFDIAGAGGAGAGRIIRTAPGSTRTAASIANAPSAADMARVTILPRRGGAAGGVGEGGGGGGEIMGSIGH